jgi:hypothetical protein
LLLCGAAADARRGREGFAEGLAEDLTMAGDTRSWFDRVGLLGRSHLATQLSVLLPVLAIAGLTAWTMLSAATSARGQSSGKAVAIALQEAVPLNSAPAAPVEEAATPSSKVAPPLEQPAAVGLATINGLKISSQSWRRGGLGSNALVTFTLRNDNAYAVKDIEIACAFSRSDGSHLTDRKRLIPDTVVSMKSRKTFARLHVGYVNINANKAKCAPVAANRI